MFLSAKASTLQVLIADHDPEFAAMVARIVASVAGNIDVEVTVSTTPTEISQQLKSKFWNVIFLDADSPIRFLKTTVLQNQMTARLTNPILIFLFHQDGDQHPGLLLHESDSYAFTRRNLNKNLIKLIIRTAKENIQQSVLLDTTITATNQHAIVAVTDPDGVLTYVNDRFCKVCEYARDELIGKNHRILASGYHSADFFAQMWATIRSGSVWKGEIKNKTRTGKMIWLQTTIIPFLNESGLINRYVTVRTDITALKMQQEEALNKAVHTTNFLANVSHEIRTPVHAILGIATLLKDPLDRETAFSYLESLNESAESLLTLVNDLLDYSKVEARQVKLELVDFYVAGFVEKIELMFGHLAEAKGLKLLFSVQKNLPWFKGDPTRIKQILVNLIGNALKFTDTGTVSVELTYDEAKSPSELLFSVRDTGIGMRPETVASLFQPFQQGDESIYRKYGGTGLGLSISKKLVDLMSGTINVTSEVGGGSMFQVCLPLAIGKDTRQSVKRSALPSALVKPLIADGELIVIDDDQLCRIVTSALLKKIGFSVVSFPDGLSALEYIKTATVNGVIVDNNLPDMSGKDVAKSIRSLGGDFASIPIIAVTGDTAGSYDFKADGFTEWLVKPVKESQIMECIQQHRVSSC